MVMLATVASGLLTFDSFLFYRGTRDMYKGMMEAFGNQANASGKRGRKEGRKNMKSKRQNCIVLGILDVSRSEL